MRLRLAAALTLTTALVLTGCSDSPEEAEPSPTESAETDAVDQQPEPTEEDVAALEAVTVEGPLGAAPTLTFEMPFQVSAPVARVDVEGEGAPLEEGQRLTLQSTIVSGDDGTVLGSTWETGEIQTLVLGSPEYVNAINDVFEGQNVGVRVLFAAPGSEATAQSEAFPATLMAIEVVDAVDIPTRASGEAVEPAEGLPTVTLADDGEPDIEGLDELEEPSELIVQTLIQGEGPAVTAGQNLTVQYKGWLLDGTVFDSSWEEDRPPFETQIGVGAVVDGWDQGLVGQTVGSQVLLIVPPSLGYGDTDRGTIPAGSTLVFVVDILAAA
ncbi:MULTISPECIES: FKBP-type peptidyl-prolyl cis-trans isomerase [unclassified Actinotalea]|uniref:FKBP-type peptidyl-prolyl cis-trans isomerase n=1 Tax=unclassified Actinotalea TaxID=2638618 RepID=UPI0015F748B3|nr:MULTISPECIES: FKBP-type peptidyl-prolyl cis-trans isomerase [unclassified Actinotalea]